MIVGQSNGEFLMHDDLLTPARIAALVLGTLATSSAFAWGDAAISAWTARNAALAAAVDQSIDSAAPPNGTGQPMLYTVDSRGMFYKPNADEKAASDASGTYVVNIVAQCKGLTGELIKNGGRNMPTWAQTAQQRFCSGAEALENSLVDKPADKKRCKDLASAAKYAGEAKAGEDPEAVVQSAALLAAAAEKLRSTPIVMTQKGKVLGDGERVFRCD